MAYKTFVNGFPLNASEINNNLMNQSVATFLDASARSTAISAPVQGQVTYLTSDSTYYSYDGAAWVEMIPTPETPASSPNYIINGAFDVAQRGTSTTVVNGIYDLDRWQQAVASGVPTGTVSQVAFSPNELVAEGFGDAKYYRKVSITANNGCTLFRQSHFIEDVETLAGQTVTVSFWAKGNVANETFIRLQQRFGSGGSATITTASQSFSYTTSWVRHSFIFTIPSISGKTVGTGSSLAFLFDHPLSGGLVETGDTQIWGVQLEAGSVATPFKRNAPSLQGELAACQRYYVRFKSSAAYDSVCMANGLTTTAMRSQIPLPTEMRAAPTFSTSGAFHTSTGNISVTPSLATGNSKLSSVTWTGSGITAYYGYYIRNNNDAGAYIDFSAEL